MRLRALQTIGFLSVVGAFSALAAAATAPPFAKTTESGKSLVIPAEHSAKGNAFHALPARSRQIYFESNAPLEDFKGQSNQVIGYTIAARGGTNLVAGEWHLPVKSMKTGIDLRDEHLAGKEWLNAKAHPNIVFQLTKTESVSLVKETENFSTYQGTLIGELTLHGVTRPVRLAKTRFTFMPASARTAGVAQGDLLAVRTKMTVRLANFNVSHPVIGDKVAETVEIDISLTHASIAPEAQRK